MLRKMHDFYKERKKLGLYLSSYKYLLFLQVVSLLGYFPYLKCYLYLKLYYGESLQ